MNGYIIKYFNWEKIKINCIFFICDFIIILFREFFRISICVLVNRIIFLICGFKFVRVVVIICVIILVILYDISWKIIYKNYKKKIENIMVM